MSRSTVEDVDALQVIRQISLFANQCVGEVSPCKCSTSDSSFDEIADNHYYSPTVNTSAPVCPAGSKIETGSENAPMPTTDAVLSLARAALGMPHKEQ